MDPKDFEALLGDVESRLDRLRSLYEQYFQGIERTEPVVPRKEVDRRLVLLMRNQPRNTAMRFRYQMIVQKYTTYQVYWRRIVRQIEEGTYHPHVVRARARMAAQRERPEAEPKPKQNAWEIDIDVVDLDTDALFGTADVESALSALGTVPPRPSARPVISPFALKPSRAPEAALATPKSPSLRTPNVVNKPAEVYVPPAPGVPKDAAIGAAAKPSPAPPAPKPPPPAPKRPPPAPPRPAPAAPAAVRGQGGGGVDIRQVYDRYVEARRNNNERVDNVRYETLEKSIHNMLPKLHEKHKGKRIEFEIVVKDGKVGLKPVPK